MSAENNMLRMQYAGAIGLLCEISTRITDEFEKEALIAAVADWCELSGWQMRVVLDRVEVLPPPEASA